ncbi:MAG: ketopantoate reductase family protein [Dehalococcoidales bacterium]|nr:MAG: ketopantoate reductase family protein [Dehalococcoidales bacterium]
MRLIIYGAGGIGCVVGGHLARTGHDVVLVGRPGHVQAISEHGLRLITPTGTYTLQIPAVTEPDQIDYKFDDVVLLCVKGQSTEEALRDLKAVTEDLPIFCLQNGVRNEEIVVQHFPRVYGVMVRVGAVYLTEGEVIARRDPPGWLITGCYPEGTDELVELVATQLRTASFYVKTTPDVMPYKWGKLLGNLNNAIGAITNVRGNDIEPIIRAARQEFREVLKKADIRFIPAEEVAQEWPAITEPLRGRINTEAQSSTWQSLARGQGTVETEFLNGEIVRLAKKLGMQAPVNEALMHISQEMAANHEPPGKYTPAQLCDLLGLDH